MASNPQLKLGKITDYKNQLFYFEHFVPETYKVLNQTNDVFVGTWSPDHVPKTIV